ncbi:metal ABC transporter solute-binding protein, Zn/Mn family [Companilactobacillus mishanensis]|uniref:metal ABC transporter solute-binding protein, Zn/Mn family n=1 Tax=Companilactobacillus mishanensis TaxID=2486008 RepID=UPI0012980C0E|nr:zinc ABC transporter substrate-binding protein [Companilactobacillus mishanensis]MQS90013.1 zinc ABC transporter substrate-binding protein [Companilactobacillus mishanensis]
MNRRNLLIASLLVFLLVMTGCSKSAANNKEILTTTNTYYEPAKSIVGDKYKVDSIIKSVNVDPHSYKPTTEISKRVSEASLIVSNGLGYDDWINKIVESNNRQDDLLNFSSDVLHKKNGQNEHLWLDVDYMKSLSKILYQRVSEMDALNKKYYKKNYNNYLKKLDKLSDKEADIRKVSQGKTAYVSEPLPDYMLKDLGVKVANNHFAKAIEDGTDPSIKDIRDMQNGMKNRDVDFIVINKQVSSSVISKIVKTAKENNIPIVYITETIPSGMGYYQWMDRTLDSVARALK